MQKSIKIIAVVGICILIVGMSFMLIQFFPGGSNGVESPPVNPAVNLSFTDTDLDVLEIGGNVVITRAVNESDITHYILYWGSDASTKWGSAIAEIAKTGSNIIYPITQNTTLFMTYFLVYTKNTAGEMATGVNCSISDNATPTERLINGNFESGNGVGWVQTAGSYDIIMEDTEPGMEVHTGSWGSWLGGATDYIDSHYQQVTISPNATVVTLSYYYFIETAESSGAWDYLNVYINTSLLTFYSNQDDTASSWYYASFDLSAYNGTTINLLFTSDNDHDYITSFFIDEVSLKAND